MKERPQNANLIPAKPGEVRNPNGRPKGSRNKLGEEFLVALHADFMEHGEAVIQKVREEKPDQYLKVIAQVVPKDININDLRLADLPDEAVFEYLDALRSFQASVGGATANGGSQKAPRHKGSGGSVQ